MIICSIFCVYQTQQVNLPEFQNVTIDPQNYCLHFYITTKDFSTAVDEIVEYSSAFDVLLS